MSNTGVTVAILLEILRPCSINTITGIVYFDSGEHIYMHRMLLSGTRLCQTTLVSCCCEMHNSTLVQIDITYGL